MFRGFYLPSLHSVSLCVLHFTFQLFSIGANRKFWLSLFMKVELFWHESLSGSNFLLCPTPKRHPAWTKKPKEKSRGRDLWKILLLSLSKFLLKSDNLIESSRYLWPQFSARDITINTKLLNFKICEFHKNILIRYRTTSGGEPSAISTPSRIVRTP